ncbi:hypothetical protein HYPSUDRAFT_46079 [Hypholoma sublateritium FD-334 SS-4]|uniref:RlpA-like protein double-psi beta-barrel domain-containing protein n=1 Tax=Hypholoma sublateritium (strain FD-334 SS-4) TaxID=945553 RepID=A0A0D2PBU2_HYPSF|nr:hypothetical protein HYPSUDRAFT_46079 [Hypholoma sublateritium FD-334 SS-4]
MHSFIPSLSLPILLSAVLLCPSSFFGSPTVFTRAAELAPNGLSARGLGHSSHIGINHRRRGADPSNTTSVQAGTDLTLYPGRRAAGATFTWFVTGLGACGNFNVPSDFIVALDREQFDVDSHCGAAVTITINGKVAHATIADRCKGCGFNNLDLTQGLYAYFDPTMNGQLEGEWEFGNGAPAPTPTPTPTPTPKPTPKPSPKPSTTSTSTTSTSHPTSTTKSIQTTSAVSSTINSTTTTATSATEAAPTPTVVAGNIEAMFGAFLGMGSILVAALNNGTSN